MYNLFRIIILGMLLYSSVYADWVVVRKASGGKGDKEITIKSKDHKIRVDMGSELTTFLDERSNERIALMHDAKKIMKMDAFMMKGTTALLNGALGSRKDKESILTPTGDTEKVGEWECDIFEWEDGFSSGKFWVSKDFPDYQEISALVDKSNVGGASISVFPKLTEFKGMVIKSHTSNKKLGFTIITTLVSAKKEEVDASVFVLPKDYTEIKVPGIPSPK